RPKHETLYDLEAGYRVNQASWYAGANIYYMDYTNQLILTGQLNDVGAAIRTNVEDSYRLGIELEGVVQVTSNLQWSGNLTLSENRIPDFSEFIDDYDLGGQKQVNFSDTPIALSPDVVASSSFMQQLGDLDVSFVSKFVSRQYLDNSGLKGRSIDPYFMLDLVFDDDFIFVRGVNNR